MTSVIEHIEYLLLHHDCVIVPGFGCFLAQPCAAHREGDTTFCPPTREIVFNPEVKHNDGLIASSLAKRHGITYAQALERIESFVESFHTQLQSVGELPVGRLGHFKIGDTLEFVPAVGDALPGLYSGLERFDFPLLARDEDAGGERTNAKPGTLRHYLSTKAVEVAASAMIIVGLGLVFSSPMATSHQSLQRAAIEMPAPHKPAAVTERPATQPIGSKVQVVAPQKVVEMTDEPQGKYHLVINVFQNELQARKFVDDMRDVIKCGIVKRGGIYRIYVAQSDDYFELAQQMKKLPPQFSKSWIGK